MNLCSSGHEEICFETKTCPLCEKIEEYIQLEEKKDMLQEEHDNV